MTVAELGRRISSREVTEWMLLFEMEAAEQAEREKKAKGTSGSVDKPMPTMG